jgi:hypothetical protein
MYRCALRARRLGPRINSLSDRPRLAAMGRGQVNRVCAPGPKTFVIGYLRMSGLVRTDLLRIVPSPVGVGAANNSADASADSVRRVG